MYGIVFVLLGNLAGNAVSLGTYVMDAAGQPNASKGHVLGLAIASLSISCLLHVFSRRGGLLVNNAFAVFKVTILLVVILLGFIYRAGYDLGGGNVRTNNFDPGYSFADASPDLANYTNSLLFILYTYSGYEQPFYILSEVDRPRRNFPRAVLIAMAIASGLFLLVNVAFFCVVPISSVQQSIGEDNHKFDMAVLFFEAIFGGDIARRIMSGVIVSEIPLSCQATPHEPS